MCCRQGQMGGFCEFLYFFVQKFVLHVDLKNYSSVSVQSHDKNNSNCHRRITYFTREQVRNSAQGGRSIPDFLVEIISTDDKLNRVEKKLTEYFEAGVKVVWVVIPKERVVNVYTSRREVKASLGDDLCSAAPVLPDFAISVNEMLALR